MKDGIINSCKNLKAVFDALSILKKLGVVFGFLSSLGSIGYFYTDTTEPAPEPEPVVQPTPEYALKNHEHLRSEKDWGTEIKKAIIGYDKQHDPKKLQH